jgi:hypothetical protein
MQKVKNGPYVPVEIRVEREIDHHTGELLAPERLVAIIATTSDRADAARLWSYLTPISRAEFKALLELHHQIPAMAATKVKFDLTTPMRP